jgi:hypothetical protein
MHECCDHRLKIDVKRRYGWCWSVDKTRLREAGIVVDVNRNSTNVRVFGLQQARFPSVSQVCSKQQLVRLINACMSVVIIVSRST